MNLFIYHFSKILLFLTYALFPPQNSFFLTIPWSDEVVFWLRVVLIRPTAGRGTAFKKADGWDKKSQEGPPHTSGALCWLLAVSALPHRACLYTWCLIFQCFSTWWPSYRTAWTSRQESKSNNYQVFQGPALPHFCHHVLSFQAIAKPVQFQGGVGRGQTPSLDGKSSMLHVYIGKESPWSSLDPLPCPLTLSLLIKVGILIATSTRGWGSWEDSRKSSWED